LIIWTGTLTIINYSSNQ